MSEQSEGAGAPPGLEDLAHVINIKELGEGQNFFDQRPFRDAFAKYNGLIASGDIARGLSSVISTADRADRKGDLNIEEYVYGFYQRPDKFVPTGLRVPKEVSAKVFQGVLDDLRDNPAWTTYLKDKLDFTQYDRDGVYHQKTKSRFMPIDTYYNWMFKRAERDQRIKASAIYEQVRAEFPQDFGDATLTDVARESGKGIARRDWVVKEGSGSK